MRGSSILKGIKDNVSFRVMHLLKIWTFTMFLSCLIKLCCVVKNVQNFPLSFHYQSLVPCDQSIWFVGFQFYLLRFVLWPILMSVLCLFEKHMWSTFVMLNVPQVRSGLINANIQPYFFLHTSSINKWGKNVGISIYNYGFFHVFFQFYQFLMYVFWSTVVKCNLHLDFCGFLVNLPFYHHIKTHFIIDHFLFKCLLCLRLI